MSTRTVPVLLLSALLWPAAASAMHISRSVSLAAWSADGNSALLRADEDGPEGGGSHGYLVVSTTDPRQEEVTLSSNFSHGDPQRPESISVQACADNLKRLRQLLDAKGFKGIAIDETCANRRAAVVLDAEVARVAKESAFKGSPPSLGGWRLASGQGGLELTGPSGKVSLPTKNVSGDELSAMAAPGFRLLLVFAGPPGERLLADVFSCEDDCPARLRPLASPRSTPAPPQTLGPRRGGPGAGAAPGASPPKQN